MKDSSAVLLAILMGRDIKLFQQVFDRVVDNGKMLRTFCQVVRSGKFGRKSFGSAPKRMIQTWLEKRSDKHLFEDSVGNDPSLVDIIKMVHPRPNSKSREVFYAYLLGKKHNAELLPVEVRAFEEFKVGQVDQRVIPNVPFQLLTSTDLSDNEWKSIATNARWHMTRMNLNTFERHNVLKDAKMVKMIAERLSSAKDIKESKVFPYQLYTAYMTADTVPMPIRNALQDAMEVATENTPALQGKIYLGVDCSGSMQAAVTGNRGSATSKVNCNNVASLMASCILRKAQDCTVYRFDSRAELLSLNPRDSIMTNTTKIGTNGGSTDCGCVLNVLNAKGAMGDVVVILSDNESWSNQYYQSESTNLMREWVKFKQRNPKAKLVCVDLAASATAQAPSEQKDVLNVGGFSDNVFEVVASFLRGDNSLWSEKINREVSLQAE